jgi:hypothetical protein
VDGAVGDTTIRQPQDQNLGVTGQYEVPQVEAVLAANGGGPVRIDFDGAFAPTAGAAVLFVEYVKPLV